MAKTQTSNIPVLILAGGMGTRLLEETQTKPKPMITIGGIPILVHIMRHYYAHGFRDFVICAGYLSSAIKKYFSEYELLINDLDLDFRNLKPVRNVPPARDSNLEQWRVRVIDTGEKTMTGARIFKALQKIQNDTPFEHVAVTYGDGVCDVDLTAELDFHLSHDAIATVLGTKNNSRYGELELGSDGATVKGFMEKPEHVRGRINGGFFIFKKEILSHLSDDESLALEKGPLAELAAKNQLRMFKHDGFWYAMDTLKDKNHLEDLWASGKAPWSEKKNAEEHVHHRSKRVSRV